MERTRRRRELVFLGLTGVMLAAAVGLFLCLSRPARRPRQAETKPADQHPPAQADAGQARRPRRGRDPFAARRQDNQSAAANLERAQMKLVGIVKRQGSGRIAVIRVGQARYYVAAGQQAAGYRVLSIGEDRAVLEGGQGEITLLLHEPGQAPTAH